METLGLIAVAQGIKTMFHWAFKSFVVYRALDSALLVVAILVIVFLIGWRLWEALLLTVNRNAFSSYVFAYMGCVAWVWIYNI